MQRTIRLQLNTTEEQVTALVDTVKQYTDCFNAVASLGFNQHITNGVALHKQTYYLLRQQYPELPAQLVCASRVKATEATKSALALQKKGRHVTCPHGVRVPIRYDARTYRILPADSAVSLASNSGRQIVAFNMNPYVLEMLGKSVSFDSADLIYRKGRFFLHVVITLPDVEFVTSGQVVGVDLGITRPAVTSNKLFHGERRWKEINQRYFRLKCKLQAKGTKSAKRHLKTLGGKVQRFRRDCDHVISQRIIESVNPGTVIAVENLENIRVTTKQRGRKSRRRMHSWSFAQLRGFLEYKDEEAGCRVEDVDPRHTSTTCSRCGYTNRLNRLSQSVFKCRLCAYELNAELNAGINIAAKYHVGDGISVSGGPLSIGLSLQSANSASYVSSPKKDIDGDKQFGPTASDKPSPLGEGS
ncbi:MAG: RNA-guided endonuclease InsQ/TnpB family protein [Armatimonadota bacterium]